MKFTFRGSEVWCNLCGVKMIPHRMPFDVIVERCPKCGQTFRIGKRPADMPKGVNRGPRKRKG